MSANYSTAVNTAKEYYNSDDADNFYYIVWGGEDIHVGMYRSDDEPIFDASRRTVEYMAARLENLRDGSRVLDIGAGYGGAARFLATRYGCRVDALNLSEVENRRDREMNKAQGVDGLIHVIDGSFEDIPAADGVFDVVWSQDAILHSGNRFKVLEEVVRVLKPGGELVFTDPMQADDCPDGVLQPILERIHLGSLGSPAFYTRALTRLGMADLGYEDHTAQLVTHYSRVLRETERRETDIRKDVSDAYIQRMKKGLRHWIDGGKKGYLAWGVFLFRKGAPKRP
jgi:sarcosine/dimethylglycine N-methyltransferase